ncbi:hypothetical protein L218DRAFT_263980 [Marasmius fiardii PR-910]|nr:hypothetical protein L218DRAFT_263980 [Marasmius fiardii PR-910]
MRTQTSMSQNSGLPLHGTGNIERHSPIGANLSLGLKRPRIPTISTQTRHDIAARNPNSSSSVSTGYEYQSPSSASPFRHPPLQGQPDYHSQFPVSTTPSPASTSSSFGSMPITGSDSFSGSTRSSQQPPSRSVGVGGGGFPPRSSSSYDTAGIYNTSMRHGHGSGTSGNGGTNLFNFLDPDSSHSRSQTSPAFSNIDWPVHSTSSNSQNSGDAVDHHCSNDDNVSVGFSSGSSAAGGNGNGCAVSSVRGRRSFDSMSWERNQSFGDRTKIPIPRALNTDSVKTGKMQFNFRSPLFVSDSMR